MLKILDSKRLKVFLSSVLAAVSLLTAQETALAAQSSQSDSAVGEDTAWIVPLTMLEGNTSWYRSNPQPLFNGEANWNPNSYALVEEEDGRYRVTIQYHSYDIWEMIQITDPQRMDELKEEYGKNKEIPMGTFNAPENFFNEAYYQEDLENRYFSESMNSYYLAEDQCFLYQKEEDQALGVGYLSFYLNSLSDQWVLKAYNTLEGFYTSRATSSWMYLNMDGAMSASGWMDMEPGEYAKGFFWSNYAKTQWSLMQREYISSDLQFLNGIFDREVRLSVDEQGQATATFTVIQNGEDPITSIRVARSRTVDPASYYVTTEYEGTKYEELYEAGSDTITLQVEDLIYGSWIAISTKSLEEENAVITNPNIKRIWVGCLHLTDQVKEPDEVFTLESNGAVLTTSTASLSKDSVFTFEQVDETSVSYLRPEHINNITAFAKDAESYEIYRISLTDQAGNTVTPVYPVTISMPIPQRMETKNLTIVKCDGTTLSYLFNTFGVLDEESRTFTITPDFGKVSSEYAFIDRGEILQREEIDALEEGIYRMRATISHDINTVAPSMSNAALKDSTVYLDVLEKGKSYRLYTEMQRVIVSGKDGYMSGASYYNGNDKSSKTGVTRLSYQSDGDNLLIDGMAEEVRLHYIKRFSMALLDPLSDGSYQVSFIVPIMDGFSGTPGDGNAEAMARLRLIAGSAEKVEENPLAGFDKTILKAVIDKVTWYLETMEDGEAKQTLEAALAEAEQVYQSDPAEDVLLAAEEKLSIALKAAGGGEQEKTQLLSDGNYMVPVTVYGAGSDKESVRKAYFGDALVTIEGNQMQIRISTLQTDGDFITALYYMDGVQNTYQQAEPVYGEDGIAEAFLFSRQYTESRIELCFMTQRYEYENYADIELDLAHAQKVTATSEMVEALQKKLSEMRNQDPADYTAASYEAYQALLDEVGVVLDTNQGSYTYDLIVSQDKKLDQASEVLVSLKALRELMEKAEGYTGDNYRESSYQNLQTALETARQVLEDEQATKEQVAEQETALKAAIKGLLPLDKLSDGAYDMPFGIYRKATGTTLDAVGKAIVESVQLEVGGDEMTVYLNMKANSSGIWADEVRYLDDSTGYDVGFAGAKNAKVTATDEEGHITQFRFTVPYTEERFAFYFYFNGSSRTVYLGMEFDNASVDKLKGDPTELTQTLETAKACVESEYTKDSYQGLGSAVTAAEAVLAAAMPEQEELDQQTALVKAAMEALIRRGDCTQLEAMLETAKEQLRETGLFTEESLEQLETAVGEVEKALEDKENLSEADMENWTGRLQEAVDRLQDKLLPEGHYTVPVQMYEAGEEVLSSKKDYFGNASVTVDGNKIEIRLKVLEHDGAFVENLYYAGETAEPSRKAEKILSETGAPEAFVISRSYTEERIPVYFVIGQEQNGHYADMELTLDGADRVAASEELVAELRNRIETARSLKAADYSAATYEKLTVVLGEAEGYLQENQGHYTQDMIAAQIENLEAAVNLLAPLETLRGLVEQAEGYTADNYRESSYQNLLAALETARQVLEDEQATKEQVAEQETALKAAIKGLLPLDKLSDGVYDMPFGIYRKATGTTLDAVGKVIVESVQLEVEGDEMTVYLNMKANSAGTWAEEVRYLDDSTGYDVGFAGAKNAKVMATDEEGHITQFRFTVPYTEERFAFYFYFNGSSRTVYLGMEFDNASVDKLKGDPTELTQTLETAKACVESEYTKDSYERLAGAIADAEAVLADDMAEQDALDQQTALVKEALEGLVLRGDTTQVAALLEELEGLTEEDYTAKSWEVLQEVLTDVQEKMIVPENVSVSDAAELEASLTAAKDQLIVRGDSGELETLLADAQEKQKKTGTYTVESLTVLGIAIEQVEAALEDKENLSETDVDALLSQLQEAVEALVKETQESEARKALGAYLEQCDYAEDDYTEDSWSSYQAALEQAEETYAKADLPDKAYQEALDELEAAVYGLEEKRETEEVLEELAELLERMEAEIGTNADGYEQTSWDAYQAALSMADVEDYYLLNEQQIRAQMAWMEAEASALIYLADLQETGSASASYVNTLQLDEFDLDEYEEELLEEELTNDLDETGSAAASNSTKGSQTETESGVKNEIKTETETEAKDETLAGTGAGAKDESEAETGTEAKDELPAGTGAEAKDESETETGTEVKDETLAGIGAGAKDESGSETEAEAKDESDAKTGEEAKGESPAGTGAGAKDESGAKTGAEAKDELPAGTGAEAKAESQAESSVKAGTGSKAGTEAKEESRSETKVETDAETSREDQPEDSGEVTLSRSRSLLSMLHLSSSLASSSNAEKEEEKEKEPESKAAAALESETTVKKQVRSVKTASAALDDGTYEVNYVLRHFSENKNSMGNPAFVKPAKVIVKNGKPTVYLQLKGMSQGDLYGHLLWVKIMDNLETMMEDGSVIIVDYDLVNPVYTEYSNETDDYGPPSGQKYPKMVGFEIPAYQTNTPVYVNVPIMKDLGGAEQPAYLRIYWDTCEKVNNSTNLDGSIDPEPVDPQPEEPELELEELNQAIADFREATRDSSKYISESYYAGLKSVAAGEAVKTLSGATQEMVDKRVIAIKAATLALIPVATEAEKAELKVALEKAEEFKISDYTEESYKKLTAAMIAAEETLSRTDVTAGMVERDRKALEKAIRTLVEDISNDVKKGELEEWIAKVKEYLTSDEYTTESKNELAEVLYEAMEVFLDPDAAQEKVDSTTEILRKAAGRLEKAADKTELYDLLETARKCKAADYTEASYASLVDAIAVGVFVYKDKTASVDTVKAAANGLNLAMGSLVKLDGSLAETALDAAKNELESWLNLANEHVTNKDGYTDLSYQALALTLPEARNALRSDDISEVKSAMLALQTAISGLDPKNSGSSGNTGTNNGSSSTDTDNSGSDEDDGYYEVNVRLWHATMNKASMGDPAIVRKAYVHIDDGDITMRLQTKKMTTSGITTHLYDFWIYDGSDYEKADLVSTENSRWTFEFDLPNDNKTYYKCQVDPRVDVMGDDPVKARLKIDWDSLDEVDEDDWDDLEGDTDDDDDDDDSSTSSGSGAGSNTTLTSAETGIQISGKVNGPGYMVEAVRLYEGSDFNKSSSAMENADVRQFAVYDVKLRSGNDYVQPASSVTLSIPIPADYDSQKLELYRVSEDGTKTLISGRVNGSYYEAAVDHFSLFVLAESNQVKAAAVAASADAGTASAKSNTAAAARTSGGTTARSTSTGSTKTGSTNTGSTKKTTDSTDRVGSAAAAVHMVDGREIPYTGDPTPVKELACMGLLAMAVCLSTAFSGKKKREEE